MATQKTKRHVHLHHQCGQQWHEVHNMRETWARLHAVWCYVQQSLVTSTLAQGLLSPSSHPHAMYMSGCFWFSPTSPFSFHRTSPFSTCFSSPCTPTTLTPWQSTCVTPPMGPSSPPTIPPNLQHRLCAHRLSSRRSLSCGSFLDLTSIQCVHQSRKSNCVRSCSRCLGVFFILTDFISLLPGLSTSARMPVWTVSSSESSLPTAWLIFMSFPLSLPKNSLSHQTFWIWFHPIICRWSCFTQHTQMVLAATYTFPSFLVEGSHGRWC